MRPTDSSACPHCGSINIAAGRNNTTFCHDCGAAFEEIVADDKT